MYVFINLFLVVLDLVAAWAFLSLPPAGAPLQFLCAGFSLQWFLLLQGMGSRTHRLISCSSWAQQLCCMTLVAPWHVVSPRPAIKPRSPASLVFAGRLYTTQPPGKPPFLKIFQKFLFYIGIQPINNIVIVLHGQQRYSAIHIHVYPPPFSPRVYHFNSVLGIYSSYTLYWHHGTAYNVATYTKIPIAQSQHCDLGLFTALNFCYFIYQMGESNT